MHIDYFYQPVSSITKLAVGMKSVKVDKRTRFQHVIIAELYEYGLSLILDDLIQVTKADEAYYHEALVHPALFLHEKPDKVLIIGGGDGCAAREVLKHDIESLKLVDIDGELVELCKTYLKEINQGSLENKKLELVIADGKEFVNERELFDCIILDLTDPFGAEIGRELYSSLFYSKIKRLLHENSVLVTQAGTAFYYSKVFDEVYGNLAKNFKHVFSYENWIPSFGYSCCFILASDKYDPLLLNREKLEKVMERKNIPLKFYNPNTHEAMFKKGITRMLV